METKTILNKDDQEMRAINVRVPKELYENVRIYGIKQGKKLREVVIDALRKKIETV